MQPKAEILRASLSATIENGENLLEDAKLLFDWDRFSTALALAVLAQEEFAKAFLLELVADGTLPWLREVQRSMVRHQCKHLLGIVMEWLPLLDFAVLEEQSKGHREWHERKMAWLQRRIDRCKQGSAPDSDDAEPIEPRIVLPPDVATALNIYRHEEIERLRCGNPWRDQDWSTGRARKIADGALDRKKQSALYVSVTNSGEIGLHPGLITRQEAADAIGLAERFKKFPALCSDEYVALKEVLRAIFDGLTDEGTGGAKAAPDSSV